MTPTEMRTEADRLAGQAARLLETATDAAHAAGTLDPRCSLLHSLDSAPLLARVAELRSEAAWLEEPEPAPAGNTAATVPAVNPTAAVAPKSTPPPAAPTRDDEISAAVDRICGFLPSDRKAPGPDTVDAVSARILAA